MKRYGLLAAVLFAACNTLIISESGVECGDGQDNDLDGLFDCDEPECAAEAACAAVCGDGVAAGADDCDGADLAGADCRDLGFDGGALGCDTDCTFDVAGC